MGKALFWKVNKRADRVIFYKTRPKDLKTIRIIVPISDASLLKLSCRVVGAPLKAVKLSINSPRIMVNSAK